MNYEMMSVEELEQNIKDASDKIAKACAELSRVNGVLSDREFNACNRACGKLAAAIKSKNLDAATEHLLVITGFYAVIYHGGLRALEVMVKMENEGKGNP